MTEHADPPEREPDPANPLPFPAPPPPPPPGPPSSAWSPAYVPPPAKPAVVKWATGVLLLNAAIWLVIISPTLQQVPGSPSAMAPGTPLLYADIGYTVLVFLALGGRDTRVGIALLAAYIGLLPMLGVVFAALSEGATSDVVAVGMLGILALAIPVTGLVLFYRPAASAYIAQSRRHRAHLKAMRRGRR